ncbi:MAG: AAA family ATPase [Spirochaetaceae bacterium]|nr:AAA family ATPase [Spirochaetaceae bacterium]
MTFTIHRGAAEIGGSCVEVCTTTTRVIIDIGMPLMNPDGSEFDSKKISELSVEELRKEKILPAIPALYNSADSKETALLISHPHKDHYGLMNFVDKKLPVYIGETSHKLIEISAVFAGEKPVIENPRYIKAYEPFNFGNIEITPYFMDHACCEAYAFLLRADEETIFYSGDFRAHGRKWRSFYKFLHIAPKNVDYLLMEGTSLSREKQKFQSEEQLEAQFVKTFKETKGINLVYVAGQNIDRLVTIFRACKRCGKTFVIDFYIANILSTMAELGYGVPHPSESFSNVKVFFPKFLRRRIENLNRSDLFERYREFEIDQDEINKKTKNIVMTVRTSMEHEIKQIETLSGGTLIYSMWEGYKENISTERFLSNILKRGAVITTIHTSGHADYYTLQKMIDAVKPKQLIPIHTLESGKYKTIFPEVSVKQAVNGETIGIKEEPKRETKELTLFEHIEELGKLHEKTGALPGNGFENFIANACLHVEYVCKKLNLSELQAVLFADIVYLYNGYNLSIKDIAEFAGCKTIKIIQYINELNFLAENNFILINDLTQYHNFENRLTINISDKALDCLLKGNKPVIENYKNLSLDDFLIQVSILFENRIQNKVKYEKTIKKMNLLLENNRHLNMVKVFKAYNLLENDELVLLRFCHYLINRDEENMNFYYLEALYENTSDFLPAKRQLGAGNHELQKKGLIQNANDNGFSKADTFCLTEKAKDELFIELGDQLAKKSMRGIKAASEISEKKLFYPEKITQRITELTDLLHEEKFASIQKRLSEEKMRTGFACLFSGGPGTGKTETAYQIARLTGRGIMQVDISDTKSMWFGESEKKIKEVFTSYRAAVKNSKIAPILLFNEADAVIGKRQNFGEARSGVGQTENTIQNIILQEIENLNGILIATTNLAKNMDKAFERRFLYKIEFEKPSLETRKLIWLALMPSLIDDEANTLAKRFDFSGGQIENIARRKTVSEVLYGSSPSLEKLIQYCEEEKQEESKTKKIGF